MKKALWIFPALFVVACQPEAEKTADAGGHAPQEKSSERQATKEETSEETPAATFDVNKGDSLVGHPLEKVKPALEAAGIRYRVVEEDGESFPITMDYSAERLNFKIKDGTIISVRKG